MDQIIFKVWKLLGKKNKLRIFFVLLMIFLSSIFNSLYLSSAAFFLNSLTDNFINNNEFFRNFTIFSNRGELIRFSSYIFLLFSILNSSIQIFLSRYNSRMSAFIGSEISIKAYENILFQDYSVHLLRNNSEIINATTTQSLQFSLVINFILDFISSLLNTAAILITLLFLDRGIFIISSFLLLLLYLPAILILRKRLSLNSKNILGFNKKQFKQLQEGMDQIKNIIIENSQKRIISSYEKVIIPLRLLQAENKFLSFLPKYILETIFVLIIAFTAIFSTYKIINISIITSVGVLAISAQRLLPVVQTIFSSWSNIKSRQASIESIIDLVNQPAKLRLKETSNLKFKFNKFIELKNISFKYPGKNKKALSNINLKIIKGKTIGITGDSGSGKSTLLNILMALLEPDTGEIFIDGKSLLSDNKNAKMHYWRNNLSHMSYNFSLNDSTIRENITDNIQKLINEKELLDILELVGLKKFINSLPEKLDSRVGQSGALLSGGQIQRLGLTRELLRNKSLLLLDESTSALDLENELKIINNIQKKYFDKTIIIISHRNEVLLRCDEIIKLESGKLIFHIERDDYHNLVNKNRNN